MDNDRRWSCWPRSVLLAGGIALAAQGPANCAPASGTASLAQNAPRPAAAASVVLDGVTVVDVEHGNLLPDQRVVITGTRIRAVGAARQVPAPQGSLIVKAQGKYLIPGLWDWHTHSLRYADFFYPLFIANGVTGIRDAASPTPLDTLLLWRREILAGTRVGPPRQLFSGKAIDEEESCVRANTHFGHHTCVRTGDSVDARHLVDSLKAAGADMIKTYRLSKSMYFVVAAEARRLGVPFGGHLPDEMSAAEASDSGASIIDHPNTSGELGTLCLGASATRTTPIDQCRPLAERFTRNHTWFVPTLAVYIWQSGSVMGSILRHFYDFGIQFWSADTVLRRNMKHLASDQQPVQSDSLGYLHVAQLAGLPILAGTDAIADFMEYLLPGFSLHAELESYVAEGMTPLGALQTATLNSAKFLHATDSLGTVTPGKLADLVLLDGNPLVDITNTSAIYGVLANGRYFDRVALDSLIAGVQAQARREIAPLGRTR